MKTLTKYPSCRSECYRDNNLVMVEPYLYSSYFPTVVIVRRHGHRQPRGDVPGCWVVALRRTSSVASVVRFLVPYIELDTILLLPILLIAQLLCLMVIIVDS